MASARTITIRVLIQAHRWVGIAVGLVVVVWFASGIAMMYAGGMPQLSPQARLDHMPVLETERVRLTPAQAAQQSGAAAARPGAPVLLTVLGRPAYRFGGPAGATVFADDGTLLQPLDETTATGVARRFLGQPAPDLHLAGKLGHPDQWTLSHGRYLPLLKYEARDAAGTELYVSPASAEVVQVTTRRERAIAWIAAIPHWLYFSALRQNQPLWYRTVVWLSAVACVLAVLGLVLAFTQWRRTRPLDLRRAIPYRGGMRWHYICGALFGVFALTWAFSGLLSMEPFAWTDVPGISVPRDALTGGPPDLEAYRASDLAALPALAAPRYIKEISFRRIHEAHYLALATSDHREAGTLPRERRHEAYAAGGMRDEEVLVEATTLERRGTVFDADAILARLRVALPDAIFGKQDVLAEYDDYYYSRGGQLPLPVLRVKLGDPLQTWLYVEMRTSELVANVHRYNRVERWLYNGLHSLDFRFWYARRPLWDIGMIVLLLGGLALSSLGLWYGIRNLLR